MEVSTVSPPPASPSEGDDPCGISVTKVAMHSVTLLTCLCGLAGNVAVLWHVRRNSITIYIFDLAFADFLFLLLMVPSSLLHLLLDVSCSAPVPMAHLELLFLLSLFSYNTGLYLLTAISIQRCTSILCPLWGRCHHPQRLSKVVIALLWALSIAVILPVASLCQSHEDEHCQVALISMYSISLLLFASSMVISSTILFIKVKCGSQQQQQPKRLDIVIFLTVLFTLLLSLWNILQQLGYTPVSSQVAFLLACIHTSIKPFIYFSFGRCRRPCSVGSFRDSLKDVFEDPEENTPSSNGAALDTAL